MELSERQGIPTRRDDLTTIAVAWQQYFPQFEMPLEKWQRNWLNHHPVGTVIKCFEFLVAEGMYFTTAEHLHKVITLTLKNTTYTQ